MTDRNTDRNPGRQTVRRPDRRARLRRHAGLLAVAALGMFGFAWALVPLYEIFCEITGLNGRTSGQTAPSAFVAAPASPAADTIQREVTVQFLASVGRGLPWEFRPTEGRLRVRLGEVAETRYLARNFASRMVTGQAAPSVTPAYASRYLHKVECFCFTQQHLEAGEQIEMPVYFYVAEDLPPDVETLTLSYTMYPVAGGADRTSGGAARTAGNQAAGDRAAKAPAAGTLSMDHTEHAVP